MGEKNLDFDTIINRRNTNSLKYDMAKHRNMPEDLLPLWVADMDFKVSSYIQDAMQKQLEHGIFGYSEPGDDYFDVVKQWMLRHYEWKVEENWLVKTPGVVFAIAMAIKAYTEEGDSVIIQQPVYYPFSDVIIKNKRKLVSSNLILGEDGKYVIDFEDFEDKIVTENVKLFYLCNPHNPVGRVWSIEELERIGDICYKHHVIVVSDEIHADFVFSGKHHVFSDVKEHYKDFTITATSPSKTFNIAGLQFSNIFIPNDKLKKSFEIQLDAAGYSQLNIMGIVAAKAAYQYGEEWYQAMYHYVLDNIEYTRKFVKERIPSIKLIKNEGTYLLWFDFRGLGLSDQEIQDLVINKAGLWLDSGEMFGSTGYGFQRMNVACPRELLIRALNRLENAML